MLKVWSLSEPSHTLLYWFILVSGVSVRMVAFNIMQSNFPPKTATGTAIGHTAKFLLDTMCHSEIMNKKERCQSSDCVLMY